MTTQRLLAKSLSTQDSAELSVPEAAGLAGHHVAVYESAVALLSVRGDQQLLALGLDPEVWRARLTRTVCLAASLHDLGKANDHFQRMLRSYRGGAMQPQGLRHEWVTLLMLRDEFLGAWLAPAFDGSRIDWLAVRSAVSGHHPAMGRASPPTDVEPGAGSRMLLPMAHPDFRACLQWLSDLLGLAPPPELGDPALALVGSGSAFVQLKTALRDDARTWESARPDERRFIAAVKACVVGADVAGSALGDAAVSAQARRRWVQESLSSAPAAEEMAELVADRLNCRPPEIETRLRSFQRAVAQQAARVTFLRAGCGTGKTLAAYEWARKCCPGRRLYLCYPTTGTATEGFRDYLYDSGEGSGKAGTGLFHSRRDVDLALILDAVEEGSRDGDSDTFLRIRSLESWSTRIVSCTVDTVLSLMQNHRTGLYAWPAFASSAFVFDEVHAYDERLFGSLLRFLIELKGLPVLLMSASLPRHRLELLQRHLERNGEELAIVQGPAELEGRPRYHWLGETVGEWPLKTVQAELAQYGKVLWVCNTVNRVLQASDACVSGGLKPLLYHSRFRYEDRVMRHRDVIEAFSGDKPALAVCTQVAEMSLDLSATLLITDLAPVPSLIQRLGRLNRRARAGDPTRPFVIVAPTSSTGEPLLAPYDIETYGDWPPVSRRWLSMFPKEGISQSDLASAWEVLDTCSEMRPPTQSTWLDGGPTTQVVELRRGSPGMTVLLEQDAPAVRARRVRLAQVTVPMPPPPQGLDWRSWASVGGAPVVPREAITYDPYRGGLWRTERL